MLSLLRLERQQNICWRIRIFLFSRCYSFGIETINTFIHSCSYPENHTRLLTKMGKSLLGFWPKRPKSHTLRGGTNLYGLYKGVNLIVLSFSWDGCNTQEKWKTKVIQFLGGGRGREQGALWEMCKWLIASHLVSLWNTTLRQHRWWPIVEPYFLNFFILICSFVTENISTLW